MSPCRHIVHWLMPLGLLASAASCLPNGPPTLTVDETSGATSSAPVRSLVRRQDIAWRGSTDPPLTEPFEDTFDREDIGANWRVRSDQWRISHGRLCVSQARNQGIWLARKLPVNASIEFDAAALSAEGDIKVELWGNGVSGAHGAKYDDATSYLAIYGGWKNTRHVLAKGDEHGVDRKAIDTNAEGSDDSQRPVTAGRTYHMQVKRTDGHTLVWTANGVLVHSWNDPSPWSGTGHDHVGFANWQSPVCFDNLKVIPLP